MRIGVLSRHVVVARGLLSLLADAGPEVSARAISWSEAADVDAVLYDVVGLALDTAEAQTLRRLVAETDTVLVAVDRPLRPDLAAEALRLGAVAFVEMNAGAEELVAVLRAAVAGTYGTCAAGDVGEPGDRASSRRRLGADLGLTPAELAVLRLIASGASNQQIARELFISINTVKTRIRTAYRRLGISHRSEAVVWAIRHGLWADRVHPD